MIRSYIASDLDVLMRIWLESNISAHHFIDKNYWESNSGIVKDLLPQSTLYIYEKDSSIIGFAGLQEHYIAGIFVDEIHRSEGIGKELLNHIKSEHSSLTLQVYQNNSRAVSFYLREGFAVSKKQTDESTGETELTMEWYEYLRDYTPKMPSY